MKLPNAEDGTTQRARRCSVEEPPAAQSHYDYADAFEVTLREGDHRSAEQIFRDGLERAPSALRSVILIVHRRVLRLDVGPAFWPIVASEPDMVRLEATGPLIAGALVARRIDGRTSRLTTFVTYRGPLARIVWPLVAPLHRRVAPYLMERAAAKPAESA
ncbi:MAG TPA: hypothetical protein VHI10_10805 [Mycobacterium sp.]|nr:hypothetical protein [Mycobacterium sp.]